MTPGEWMAKADYEGGILDAVFGYGLTENDLSDQSGEFYEAVKELRALRPRIDELCAVLNLVEPEEEDW